MTDRETPADRNPAAATRRKALAIALPALLAVAAAATFWLSRFQPRDQGAMIERALKASPTDPAAAEKLLREILPVAGERAGEARLALAIVLCERNAWEQAVQEFDQLDPAACRSEQLLNLALLAARGRRFDLALRAGQAVAERQDAREREACKLLLRIYQATEQWPQERSMLRRLTRVDPTDPSHWRTLISRLDETGIQSDTIAVMREALAAAIPQPEKSRIRQELAGTLMLLGEAEEARKELEPLLAEAGRPASADLLLVKLLRLEGQPERALSLLEEILPRLGSGSSDGAAQRAMLLIDLRRYEEALPILEQVVADEPFDQFAHFKLADVYRALGQAERAGRHAQLAAEIKQKRLRIHTLTKQAAQDPSNRQLFEELAELHRELNDNEAAVKWEQRAASPRP